MKAKQLFCPGDKCKNAWKYAKRTNKLDKKEDAGGIKPVQTLIGQLTKVSTTADQCLRVQIDVPIERVKFDTIQYLNQKVVIGFVDEIGEDEKEPEQKKDSHFDD